MLWERDTTYPSTQKSYAENLLLNQTSSLILFVCLFFSQNVVTLCRHRVSGCPAGLRLNRALRAVPPRACSPALSSSAGRSRGRARTPNRRAGEREQGSPLPQETTTPRPARARTPTDASPLLPPPSLPRRSSRSPGGRRGWICNTGAAGRAIGRGKPALAGAQWSGERRGGGGEAA